MLGSNCFSHFVAFKLQNQESRSVGDSRQLNSTADGICKNGRTESEIDDFDIEISTFSELEHASPDDPDDVRDSPRVTPWGRADPR